MTENGGHAGLPVLIIGAGASGLFLAHGLHLAYPTKSSRGIRRSFQEGGRDWGIALHWATAILPELLGEEKWNRIYEATVEPHWKDDGTTGMFSIYNGATGELLAEQPVPNLRRVLRSRLRSFIAEGALDVSYNKKLERISYADDGRSVTAHFADGTSETGRLLVGADGSHSRVRRELLGPERAAVKRLPLVATFVTSSFPREHALHLRKVVASGYICLYPHPDNMLGTVTLLDAIDEENPENWRFMFYVAWRSSLEEQDAEVAAGMSIRQRLLQAKEKSKVFADPLRTCFELLPDDHDAVYWVNVSNWDPSLPGHEWDNREGRVTLIGDAAHPMTYHRGQGLSHTLIDVSKLVQLLANPENRSQAELINTYESEMRPRASEELRLSELNSYMLHDWTQVRQSPVVTRGVAYGSGDIGGE